MATHQTDSRADRHGERRISPAPTHRQPAPAFAGLLVKPTFKDLQEGRARPGHGRSEPRRWVFVSYGDPEDRWAWSGIPESIARAMRFRGEEVVRVSSEVARFVEINSARIARRFPSLTVGGRDTPPLVALRSARLRAIDIAWCTSRIVVFGSGFRTPCVDATFDDMTVAQSELPPSPGRDRWQRRQAAIYDAASRCFTSTEWAATSIRTDYSQRREKVIVAGFGPNIVCRPIPKDWSKPRFLWVGVDWHRKGGDHLLEAFRAAAIPGAALDLVGGHPPVDLPGVTCHGVVREHDRLAQMFEAATLFILPSRFDASPIVFLEAATAGTPMIATNTGGTAEHVGGAGLTIAPGDVGALIDAMRRMSSPAFAARCREAALSQAGTRTWDRAAKLMIEAFQPQTDSTSS